MCGRVWPLEQSVDRRAREHVWFEQDATDQAAAIARGELSAARAGGGGARAPRAARPQARDPVGSLGRETTRRSTSPSRRAGLSRRALPDEGRRRPPGRPALLRRQPRPARCGPPRRRRHAARRPLPRPRPRHPRQLALPRVRPAIEYLAPGPGPDPQSLGREPRRRRLLGRGLRRRRRRPRRRGPRERRRGLDPDPGRLVWPDRPQALPRPHRMAPPRQAAPRRRVRRRALAPGHRPLPRPAAARKPAAAPIAAPYLRALDGSKTAPLRVAYWTEAPDGGPVHSDCRARSRRPPLASPPSATGSSARRPPASPTTRSARSTAPCSASTSTAIACASSSSASAAQSSKATSSPSSGTWPTSTRRGPRILRPGRARLVRRLGETLGAADARLVRIRRSARDADGLLSRSLSRQPRPAEASSPWRCSSGWCPTWRSPRSGTRRASPRSRCRWRATETEGLPIGVQLVAGPGREDRLLSLAAELLPTRSGLPRTPPMHG